MTENPARFNKQASTSYQQLSVTEKEQLKQRVETAGMAAPEKVTKKKIIREGERIFRRIQKLVRLI